MKNKVTLLLICSALLLSGCLSVGDLVWLDENGNGIQDPGEPGMDDVTVTLYEIGWGPIDTTLTTGGVYSVGDASNQGSFFVEVTPPDGYTFTQRDAVSSTREESSDGIDSDVNPTTGRSDIFSPPFFFFSVSFEVDAGLILLPENVGDEIEADSDLADIGNFVWQDENQNGLQDNTEGGVEAVQVTLLDSDGGELASTSTDANGAYLFADQVVGQQYKLRFDAPEGFLLTLQDEGADDSLDSDADPESGETATFTLDVTGTTAIDAGLYMPSTGAASFCYGPGADPFPEGVSPLSGLPVSEPAYLGLNPVFTSISIFPPSVRPPSGLATAPQVFQLYIGDGDSRLLVVNYGEYPIAAFAGDDTSSSQNAAPEPANDNDYVISGRVWFDNTPDHLEGETEPGINNVEVRLLDSNFQEVATTTTNAYGLYWFELEDVEPNTEFQVRVGAPPSLSGYYFVNKDLGSDDTIDSDFTSNGRSDFFDPTDEADNSFANLDAGIRESVFIEGFRSGRTAHQDIQGNYCGCLVSAGADPEVAAQINVCGNAFSSDSSDIGGAGLDVTRLLAIAENYTENSSCRPNLADSSLFCTESPLGGSAGNELYMQYNINNISHFEYDAALGAYTWALSTPKSEAERGSAPFSVQTEDYTVMTDGLTDETLTFENVVVLMVEHTAQNAAVTIIDLEMDFQTGTAYVFRNGEVFEATWSSLYPDYVADKDNPLPVHLEVDGEPFPLAPGQTFFNIVNQFDSMTEISTGVWLADFDAPAYSPQ